MRNKGYTLIELLGVMIILSLLITLVFTSVVSFIKSSNEKKDKLTRDLVLNAAEMFIEDNASKFYSYNGSRHCIYIDTLVENNYLKGDLEYQGEDITNTKAVKVKYNNGFQYELADLYKGSCTLADYITNLYSETTITTVNEIEYSLDETHLLMNDRLGSNDVDITSGNIRYYGANPNNYIDIGDRDSEGNIIFWRIIGLFKDIEVTDENDNVVKTQDLVKIIRADNLTSGDVNKFSWDYISTGEYDNNWHNSTLQVMLNDEINGYYASGTTSYYNDSTTPTTLNFSSTGLSSEVHGKIERVKWSLGDHNAASVYTDAMYGYERAGTDLWSGKIALMYLSDYGYSADLSSCQTTLGGYNSSTCKTTNWMSDSIANQWTFIPYSGNTISVSYVSATGIVNVVNANRALVISPVLYLKSDVGIAEEQETSEGLKYLVVE